MVPFRDHLIVTDAYVRTILIVDDDPDLLELIELMLLDVEGCNVQKAANGSEALAYVEASMPDLILLDMKMPIMSGWEFAERYHSTALQEPRAPIVVVTAAENAARRAQEIEAQGWLSKPFTRADLLEEVHRHLPCDEEPGSGSRR